MMPEPPNPAPFLETSRDEDAGAVFVLQSKGRTFFIFLLILFLFSSNFINLSGLLCMLYVILFIIYYTGQWWHAGFHLTTAIVGPTLLTLPYAFRGLGWGPGFLCLTTMGVVTFYSYYLMSKVLDHCEKAGRRHIRFRELAADVLGNSEQKL